MSSGSAFLRGGDPNLISTDGSGGVDFPFTSMAKVLANVVFDQVMDPHSEIDQVRQLQATKVCDCTVDYDSKYGNYEGPIYLGALTFTLGFILLVDLVLHFLDHRAHRNAFFRKVLNTFYKELAVLGLVEWFLHYLKKINEGKEAYESTVGKALSSIHWFLFLTAVANALLCSILYLCCTWQSNKWWVQTERLEINHYIELREEFDRVQRLLGYNCNESFDEQVSIKTGCHRLTRFFRKPRLSLHHKHLLVQVRFHELRQHFLRANKLPLTFKFSTYLRKCEQQVFISIVTVSLNAWLLLMIVANLAYFSSAFTISTNTGDSLRKMGVVCYYLSCILAVIGGWLTWRKAKAIFIQIMSTDLINSVCNEENSTTNSQLKLFWWNNPDLIIQFLQFVLFIFAMLVSIVIEFLKELKEKKTVMLLTLSIMWLVCYLIFIFMMTRAIPRYTLITNIGQLTNKITLRKVLAKTELKVAIQKWKRAKKIKKRDEIQQVTTGGEEGHSDRVTSPAVAVMDINSDTRGEIQYVITGREQGNIDHATSPALTVMDYDLGTQSVGETSMKKLSSDQRLQYIASLVAKPTTELSRIKAKQTEPLSVSKKIRSFFLKKGVRKSELSIFTMLCFFLVGIRMYTLRMLQDAPAELKSKKYLGGTTVEENLESFATVSFWWEVLWLSLIILSSFLKIYAHMPLTGILDTLIGSLCLFFLLYSEVERTPSYGSFGHRAKQGLGKIEPFTSFIVLQFFCVPFGQLLRKLCSLNHGMQIQKPEMQPGRTSKEHSQAHNSMEHDQGTITELWYHAVALFPHIVDKYGEFSSQLFQAMLGMPLELEQSASKIATEAERASKDLNICVVSNDIQKSSPEELLLQTKEEIQEDDKDLKVGSKDSLLPMSQDSEDINAIIISGKTGLPVKIFAVDEVEDSKRVPVKSSPLYERSHQISSGFLQDVQSLNFEMQQADTNQYSMLIEPDAPLICSMRRCERRFLPHVTKLTVVDAVLTEFELVYLDVTDSAAMDDSQKKIRKAIVTTGGGKGLRLRDVLICRKILGHVEIQSIHSVGVQRYLTASVSKNGAEDEAKNRFWLLFQPEYWKPEGQDVSNSENISKLPVGQRGRKEQEQLQLTLTEGNIFLRFFSDMEHGEKEVVLPQGHKTEAFVWYQAISCLLVQSGHTSVSNEAGVLKHSKPTVRPWTTMRRPGKS